MQPNMNSKKQKRNLVGSWRPRRSVRIQELEDGLFLAMFEHMVDMRRVLDEGPCSPRISRRSENYVRAIAGRLGTVLEVDRHHLKE
ncbi:reverse transcriptase, partial [Tanacetum coccineum]